MNESTSSPCILFALARESAAFRAGFPVVRRLERTPVRAWRCSSGTKKILLVETGIGPERAQRALEWLACEQRPSFLVMAGYAGGLRDHLKVGDVVLAEEIVDLEGNCWATTWPDAATNVTRVRLLTTPRLLGSAAEKRRLGEVHRAAAVDMEAATVARFCSERRLPFGCVRSLSDDVHTDLSPSLVSLLDGGQVSAWRLGKSLVRRPALVFELMALAKNTRRASIELARVLRELLSIAV